MGEVYRDDHKHIENRSEKLDAAFQKRHNAKIKLA
jgi:hypothetical protein